MLQIKKEVKNLLRKIKEEGENILFSLIVLGIILISLGVYLIGSGIERTLGRNMLILGSGIFYISTVIIAFKL